MSNIDNVKNKRPQLVNEDKTLLHMRYDYIKLNENIKNNKTLCEHCGGTGNELYSMYRKCSKCNGLGYIN